MAAAMMDGRVALITGGAGGIGRAIGRRVLEEGGRVALADLSADAAKEAAGALGAGDRAIGLGLDVASGESAQACVGDTLARFGRLDALIHCAGIFLLKPWLETTQEEFERVVSVNLTGSFLCAKAAATPMLEAGYGRIVMLASVAGERGGKHRVAYGASKGGLINMVRTIAVELAPHGITINTVSPGPVETDMAKLHTPATREGFVRQVPMGRYAEPVEVAEAAVFLASERAGFMTGDVLHVDGGFVAGGLLSA
ncbi:SDR family NAD(P)-dependent oxidoreductase [Marinivivus vitaminiproducens]|uniref:SDR family NAD(P)-dependent oxidoreductase n=1 Tax=Marinivivus vitaminiproducens TaxID=3035935 RepID=UPI0027A2EA48|nr:SDR family NAD(P)-dependent oxidoreductase [Geminicoccaceae bacterium SCSIO 64248]